MYAQEIEHPQVRGPERLDMRLVPASPLSHHILPLALRHAACYFSCMLLLINYFFWPPCVPQAGFSNAQEAAEAVEQAAVAREASLCHTLIPAPLEFLRFYNRSKLFPTTVVTPLALFFQTSPGCSLVIVTFYNRQVIIIFPPRTCIPYHSWNE